MSFPADYSSWSGSTIRSAWKSGAQLYPGSSETATSATLGSINLTLYGTSDETYVYNTSNSVYTLSATGQTTQTYTDTDSRGYHDFNTFTWSKTHSFQTITVSFSIKAVNYYIGHTYSEETQGPYTDTSSGSFTFTIPAKTSYAVSFNANGGSGAPSSQTKWYGETLTLSSTKPIRSGYSFQRWNTNSSGTGTNYSPGASYTSNAALALYAVWYPVVSFNANGGSGAPSAQTKTPGTNLTLSSTIPIRSGYVFKEWNTNSSGAGTSYQPGGTYSSDSPVTLYAIWKSMSSITNLEAIRCDSSGRPCEDRGYVKVTASYQSEYAITATSATVGSVSANGSAYPAGSGTISIIVGSNFLPLSQYGVSISATSEAGTSSANAVLSPSTTYAMPTISNLVARRTTSSSSTAADAVGRYLVATFSAVVHEEGSSSSENVGNATVVFQFPGRQQTVTVPMSGSSQSLTAHSSQFSYSDIGPGDFVPNVCTATLTDKFGYQTSVTVDLERSGYSYPSVPSVRAYRSNTGGVSDDEGETATVTAIWSVASTPSQSKPSSLVLSAYDMSDILIARKTLSPSTTSGTTTYTFRGADRQDGLTSDNMFDVDEKYSIRVDVSDVYTSDYKSDILSTAYFTMDVLAGGHGVAFGKSSAKAELLDVGYDVHSDGEVEATDTNSVVHKLTKKADLDEVVTGVKGANDLYYQGGLVSLSPTNIGAVDTSGDTMTGSITMIDSEIEESTPPSSDIWNLGVYLNEAGGDNIGHLRTMSRTDGTVGVQLQAHRTVNDTNYWNGLRLGFKADATPYVGINQAAAWRTALGLDTLYLPLTGGSMTGDLSMGSRIIRNVYSIELNPGVSTVGNGGYIDFHYNASTADYTARLIEAASGLIRCYNNFETINGFLKATNNGNTVQIGSINTSWCHINNSANRPFYFNKSVHVDGDIYKYGGSRVQYVPTVLYNNTSGTTGTVTLSATAANYNHMRIHFRVYRDGRSEYNSADVHVPNGKRVGLLVGRNNSTAEDAVHLAEKTVSISGTGISTVGSGVGTMVNNAGSTCVRDNNIYIVRVEAWNE